MPIYIYRCEEHGSAEVEAGMLEEKNNACPICGKKMQRVWYIQSPIYRTGGFYTTDKRLDPVEEE